MILTPLQTILMILAVALGSALTRFLSFIVFPENKEVPEFITYLGEVLPPGMMGLLVIYCLKTVSLITFPFGFPEFIALAIVIALHIWKRNALLSIAGGTAVYMFLVQTIF